MLSRNQLVIRATLRSSSIKKAKATETVHRGLWDVTTRTSKGSCGAATGHCQALLRIQNVQLLGLEVVEEESVLRAVNGSELVRHFLPLALLAIRILDCHHEVEVLGGGVCGGYVSNNM